jgi:predicted dehydrogenase
MAFEDWRPMLAAGRVADACIVATQDRDHVEPALAAMKAGYNVLLEKPMAVTEDDCRRLVEASEAAGVMLRICHVLRCTGFFSAIKAAIDAGRLGRLALIRHSENVSYWHYAHSYVRGNWRSASASSPMILAKSCHDMDILCWLAGSRPLEVQSFGSLELFTPANAPAGAPLRCTDGCPHERTCPWFAPRLYLHATPLLKNVVLSRSPVVRLIAAGLSSPPLDRLVRWRRWPSSTIGDDPSPAARRAALATGPYGRCVFRCDNDVVDRQVVSVRFASGLVAGFSLHGHSHLEGRQIRIDGSAGTIEGSLGIEGARAVLHDHRSGRRTRLWSGINPFAAHGGGDEGLMAGFTSAVEARIAGRTFDDPAGSARDALRSHLVCFAAERSRVEDRVVRIEEGGGV